MHTLGDQRSGGSYPGRRRSEPLTPSPPVTSHPTGSRAASPPGSPAGAVTTPGHDQRSSWAPTRKSDSPIRDIRRRRKAVGLCAPRVPHWCHETHDVRYSGKPNRRSTDPAGGGRAAPGPARPDPVGTPAGPPRQPGTQLPDKDTPPRSAQLTRSRWAAPETAGPSRTTANATGRAAARGMGRVRRHRPATVRDRPGDAQHPTPLR